MKLYHIKIGNIYVRSAFVIFNEINLTPDIRKIKHLKEEEKDFVLKYFPHAEVKSFKIEEENSNFIDTKFIR